MKRFNIVVNGKAYDVSVEELDANAAAPVVTAAPAPAAAPAAPVAAPAPAASGAEAVKAPMPGTVLDIKVNVGDTVAENQLLVVFEAMKMENEIMAPKAGKIASIAVKKGDAFQTDAVMLTIA